MKIENCSSWKRLPPLPCGRSLSLGLSSAVLLTPYLGQASFENWEWRPRSVDERQIRLLPQAEIRTSTANFNSDGQREAVSDLNRVTWIHSGISSSYGLNSSFSLFGTLKWAHQQVDHTTLNYSGTVFGPTDQSLGLNFRWPLEKTSPTRAFGQTALEFQLQADFPTYSNGQAVTSGVPFLGEQTFDLTGGAFLRVPFGASQSDYWTVDLGSGLTWRSGGYSLSIPAFVELQHITDRQGLVGKTSVQGHFALGTDSNPLPSATNGAGGSYAINAVNPNRLQWEGSIGYRFSPTVAVHMYGRAPIWGRQSAVMWTGGFQLEANLGRHAGPRRPENQSASEYGKSNQGFVNYTLEGKVLKTNDRLNLIKIDKGLQDGIQKGQILDIFTVKEGGAAGEAIARGQVTSALDDQAVMTVIEYYKEIWIEEGFIIKKPIQ